MAKGKQTSAKDKAKVIEEKIKNPSLSTRDIEKETWVNNRTAARILKDDLSHVVAESEHIAKLIDLNQSIIDSWKLVIAKEVWKVANGEWIALNSMNDVKALSSILEDAFKQNQLVKGLATGRLEVNPIESILSDLWNKDISLLWTNQKK